MKTAKEVKQFLKVTTGRDNEMMEEPWEFKTLEDMVEFMLQWEFQFASKLPLMSKERFDQFFDWLDDYGQTLPQMIEKVGIRGLYEAWKPNKKH